MGHITGWIRAEDHKEERLFRSRKAAKAYARSKTGIPSFLVFHMSRKGVVTRTTRPQDWRDRLRARLNQKPVWTE